MNLINFTYEVAEEDEAAFLESVRSLRPFWRENGFDVSLFRDAARSTRFMYSFRSEKTAEDLTRFIQSEPRVREFFEGIKENGGRVLVSVMEEVV